jgi:hypothetical protein
MSQDCEQCLAHIRRANPYGCEHCGYGVDLLDLVSYRVDENDEIEIDGSELSERIDQIWLRHWERQASDD